MKRTFAILIAFSLLGGAPLAGATTFDLTATIDGAQAGTGSGATGSATMTYDDTTGLFSWNIVWGPLEGTITVAHFHGPAEPGMSAGIQVNFGSISGLTSPSIGSTTLNATQAADLLAGLWYINIHSSVAGGGEIRGQVGVVTNFAYAGDATLCTGTCDGFAALGGPGGAMNTTPSALTGVVTISGGPGGAFTFADVDPNVQFEVANAGAPLEAAIFAPNADPRCDSLAPGTLCNPTTANPLPLNSDVAELRESEPTQGTTTGGTLDTNGDLETGTLLLEFVVPPFNNNDAWAILDLATGATQVCLFYSTAGCLPGASEAVVFAGDWSKDGAPDTDGDGVTDDVDNCTLVANPNQTDSNGDLIGNACDADLNNDCGVNFGDLAALKAAFIPNPYNADADFNSDGFVNFGDLAFMKSTFFNGASPGPGPGAPGNACE